MNLSEAKTILEVLEECDVIDGCAFGPSLTDMKNDSIEIMKRVVNDLEYQQKKAQAGAGMLDSIEECPDCGGVVVTKMAGGYQCTNCDYGEIAF